MDFNAPYIHLFKNSDKNYFYDVNLNRIVKISDEVYNLLMEQQKDGLEAVHPVITKLRNNGFLSTARVKKIFNPNSELVEDILNNKIHKITLQVTQKCNFRCDYCVYSGKYENRTHSMKEMDWSVAKRAIDFLLEHSRDTDAVNIGFYGGEPLLRYDFIKQLILYATQIFEGKNLSFSMTTNGSLLTAEKAEFFLKYNVDITISLDGPEEIQNKNRKFSGDNRGTFGIVYNNIKSIIKNIPEYKNKFHFSIVIDPANKLSCINEFIINEKLLFENSTIMASFIANNNSKEKQKYSDDFLADWEYSKFLYFLFLLGEIDDDHKVKIYSQAAVTLVNFIEMQDHPTSILGDYAHHGGPCVPGQIRLFITTDGKFLPCEKVSETSKELYIGDIINGFDFNKISSLMNIGELTSNECKSCFAFRNCNICSSLIATRDELSRSLKLSACQNSKAQFIEILKDSCTLQEFGYRIDKITEVI